jgi:putative redox protein
MRAPQLSANLCPMSTFTATARSIGGSLRHEVDVNGRHTIITDEPESLGGTDTGPAPHELLAAMVSACVSTMVVLYARRHGWDLNEMRVDVEYDTDSTPRAVAVTVHLPVGLTPDQVKRLGRVAATCPVKRAFEAGILVSQELISGPWRRSRRLSRGRQASGGGPTD